MTAGDEVLTAPDADRRAAAAAGWLHRRGVGRGDRVLLAVPGSADLIGLVLGALRSGVVPVVLDAATPTAELDELVADAAPAVVVDDPDELSTATHAEGEHPPDLASVPLGRPMHYTSGTTGRRKGVWSGVLTPDAATALWAEEQQLWAIGPLDRHIVLSPLHHSAPLRFAIVTLLAGGQVLLPGKFTVTRFLAACQAHQPTTTFTAPAQLVRLREASCADPAAADGIAAALRPFRLVAHAGAPCPDPVKRWLLDLLDGERVWEFYGSSEGQFTACSGRDWQARPGTVGRARPGRTLQLDDDGRIWCTAPSHARFSYWRDDPKTAAAWRDTPDGPAFTVGDVGHLDEDGYLYLHGRRDDLIISGGVNVYPAEVERVLSQLPGVVEVAVYGVQDEHWGQRVEAAVIGTATPDDVLEFAAGHLPPARRPKRVHIVPDLPRTSTGKILRRLLSR